MRRANDSRRGRMAAAGILTVFAALLLLLLMRPAGA
jgi:hypothetical protein